MFGIDDAILWPAVFKGAMGLYSLLKPGPKAPKLPDYQAMSADDEAAIMGAIKQRIGRQTGDTITSARQDAVSRGSYRSGQLPALETGIRTAGNDAVTQAYAGLLTQQNSEKNAWQRYLTELNENRYVNSTNDYNATSEAGGKLLGESLDKIFGGNKDKDDVLKEILRRLKLMGGTGDIFGVDSVNTGVA